jgi:hypothetical protein
MLFSLLEEQGMTSRIIDVCRTSYPALKTEDELYNMLDSCVGKVHAPTVSAALRWAPRQVVAFYVQERAAREAARARAERERQRQEAAAEREREAASRAASSSESSSSSSSSESSSSTSSSESSSSSSPSEPAPAPTQAEQKPCKPDGAETDDWHACCGGLWRLAPGGWTHQCCSTMGNGCS